MTVASAADAAGQRPDGPPAPARDPMAPLPDAAPTAGRRSRRSPPVEVPPAPPPLWQVGDARALLAYIATVGSEGLDPRDYDPAGLDAALRSGDPLAMSAAATDRFTKLASDLALGHVRGKDRQEWYVNDADLTPEATALLLAGALAAARHRRVAAQPASDPFAICLPARRLWPRPTRPTRAKYNRIKLNMDRWRWLPRDLGNKYIIVNVPSASTPPWSRMARPAGGSGRSPGRSRPRPRS